MKLSSLASGIGFAEFTYQVRQIKSYSAHALGTFAVDTVLYLFTDIILGMLLTRLGPQSVSDKSLEVRTHVFSVGSILHDR